MSLPNKLYNWGSTQGLDQDSRVKNFTWEPL